VTHRQSDQHAARGPNLALSGVRRTLKNNGATIAKQEQVFYNR